MNIYISLLLSFLLAFFAYLKKSFTIAGLSTAFIICFIMCICGSYQAFLSLLMLFLITIVTDKIKKKEKESIIKDKHEKNDKRDAYQVLDNLLLACIFIIIYRLSNNIVFLKLFFISLAVSAADTSASGIGVLSKKSFNILTFKKAERGLSGNVSILGFIASLLASFFVALLYLVHEKSLITVLIIMFFGFFGAILDSVLGCVQVKYKCMKCGSVTERNMHCESKTQYYNGIKFLNNDRVNLISNIIIIIISSLILR